MTRSPSSARSSTGVANGRTTRKPTPVGAVNTPSFWDAMEQEFDEAIEEAAIFGKKSKELYDDTKEKYEKWKARYDLILKLIDPETRTIAIFEEGMEWALKGLSRILDTDLTKHPYMVIHQGHFEVLKAFMLAEAKLEQAKKLLKEGDDIAHKIASEKKTFMEKYGLPNGEQWKTFEGLSSEARLLANVYRESKQRGTEMAKGRRYRIVYLLHQRRTILRELLSDFGLLGADRTQLDLAMKAYRDKYKKMQSDEAHFTKLAGEVENKEDILKQSKKTSNIVSRMSPEDVAKRAYSDVVNLTSTWMTRAEQSNASIAAPAAP